MQTHSFDSPAALELFEAGGPRISISVAINVQSGEIDADKQSVFVCFKMIAPKSPPPPRKRKHEVSFPN